MAGANQSASLSARLFTLWGVALWLVLLQAASGAYQFAVRGMYLQMLVPTAVVVVSAGCILRQEWARRVMLGLAPLLAVWTSVMVARMWPMRERFEDALAQARGLGDQAVVKLAVEQIEHEQSAYYIGLGIKLITIPLLLWLTWKLLQPAVRAQFGLRR